MVSLDYKDLTKDTLHFIRETIGTEKANRLSDEELERLVTKIFDYLESQKKY